MKRVKLTKRNIAGFSPTALACEQVVELSTALQGYTGLERLVESRCQGEEEDGETNPLTEPSEMLISLNAEMQRLLGDLEKTAAALLVVDAERRSASGNAGEPPPLSPPQA